MPNVGQMGSTMFEGGSITRCLRINQVKLPQTKITFTYKELRNVTMFTTYTRYTKMYKDTSKCSQFAKHALIALTLLDCLHWLQSHKALKDQNK